jgi:hypothetical protein
MKGKGIECIEMRDEKCAHWEATFNAWDAEGPRNSLFTKWMAYSYNDEMQLSMPPEGPTGKRNPPRKDTGFKPELTWLLRASLTLVGARN